MSDSFLCRNVRREPEFEKAAEEIYGSTQRADEVFVGIDFVLARAPTSYSVGSVKFDGVTVHAIRHGHPPLWPHVIVYYTCDEQLVALLAIDRTAAQSNEE